jgi:hypothetical protein
MNENNINPAFFVSGHVKLWDVRPNGQKILVGEQPNQIQYSWGFIAARQLGYRAQADRPSYHISAMYIEFENQTPAAAGDAIDISTSFPRTDSVGYYNGLITSTSRDYLRVPLIIEPTLGVSTGTETNLIDMSLATQFNKLTFFVQTAGNSGVYGKPFSHANNSKIYAAALVAAPTFSDRTKDVIFARTVFTAANQVSKAASSQIGITWDISFK